MKSDIPYLKLVIESIDKIFDYLNGCSDYEFYNDDLKKDACLARLIVIGEYGSKISETLRSKFSDVEWQQIKAARNFYVHAYNHIDWTKVWDTIHIDLPGLKINVENILNEISEWKH